MRVAERRGVRRRRARGEVEVQTSSGGVVFRRADGAPRILLIRDPYENWGLPKGHIEAEETPEQAALREIAEETGLSELEIVAPLPMIDWYFRDGGRVVHKYCHFFLVESRRGELVPQHDEGIRACVWRSYRGALRTVSYENAREVLRAAGRELRRRPDTNGAG